MSIWIYDFSTSININGKNYSTSGANQSSSKDVKIFGGNKKDVINIMGSSSVANLYVYLEDGHDSLDCKLNRPLQCWGGPGNDTIFGGDRNDKLYGGDGNDELRGRKGMDELYGDGDDDTLFGDEGMDGLIGGFGKDTLYGGPASDVLIGGEFTASLGHYWNVPAWNGWMSPIPDYEQDTIFGGAGGDLMFREIYQWSHYFIYNPVSDWFYVWPTAGAQKTVLDSDFLADYSQLEGDQDDDFAVPHFPTFQFYGIPSLNFFP